MLNYTNEYRNMYFHTKAHMYRFSPEVNYHENALKENWNMGFINKKWKQNRI